jgi:hypothetical protein
MYKSKRCPSGWTQATLVSEFKQRMFAKWCMEPTKSSNHIKYKVYTMPEDYIPFPCWDLWIVIGPPAGDACNPILKIEFMAPPPTGVAPANGALIDEVPKAMATLAAGAQEERFTSRRCLQIKKEPVGAAFPKNGFISSSPLRDEKNLNRSIRLDRDMLNDKVKHLTWLSMSEFCSVAEKTLYRKQIHDGMFLKQVKVCVGVKSSKPLGRGCFFWSWI